MASLKLMKLECCWWCRAVSEQVIPRTEFTQDLDRARAIVEGDIGAWQSFVEEYGDRITWTAHRWCPPGCWRRPCPVARGYRLLSEHLDCDEIRDAALFILSKIKYKVLRVYRGQCSLASFLYPVLSPLPTPSSLGNARYGYRQMFADYLEERGKERVRPPKVIKALSGDHRAVFEDLFRGMDAETVCRRRGLSGDTFERIRRDIERALRRMGARGWEIYCRVFGPRPREIPLPDSAVGGSFEDDVRPLEPVDPEPLPDMQAVNRESENALNALRDALKAALEHLSTNEREILRLMYEQRLPARQAANVLGIPQRRAYYDLQKALQRLEAELLELFAGPEVPGTEASDIKAFRELLKQYFRGRAADVEPPSA